MLVDRLVHARARVCFRAHPPAQLEYCRCTHVWKRAPNVALPRVLCFDARMLISCRERLPCYVPSRATCSYVCSHVCRRVPWLPATVRSKGRICGEPYFSGLRVFLHSLYTLSPLMGASIIYMLEWKRAGGLAQRGGREASTSARLGRRAPFKGRLCPKGKASGGVCDVYGTVNQARAKVIISIPYYKRFVDRSRV